MPCFFRKKVYAWNLKLSYMQMQGMDTYHGSHGDRSGFESRAGLSIPRVLLSSPDGVPDEDTFLHHSFLVEGFVLITFTSDSSNSLRRICRFAFLFMHSDLPVDS